MNRYSEDELIEQPAINLLTEMGWETLNCYSEFDQGSSPLGRQTKSEVVLTSRLQPALKRLNPTATQDAITKAIEEFTRSRSLMNVVEANRIKKLKARLQTAPTFIGFLYHPISSISINRSSSVKSGRGKSPNNGRKYPAPAGDI